MQELGQTWKVNGWLLTGRSANHYLPVEPFDHHFSNMEQDTYTYLLQQKRAERSRKVAEEPTTLGLWRKSHDGKDYVFPSFV